AGALKLTGGGEFWTRACFFPFDLASAWALLALAARFLKKPLWPVLTVLAGPAWALNMNHVMAERVMAAFALPALWLAVVAADEDDARAFWASAVLASLALLSKYNALFVLPPAVVYMRSRGASYGRLAAWTAAALSGIVASQVWSWAAGGASVQAAWGATSAAAGMAWSAPSHRLRSLLAFTGGLGLPCALWSVRLRLPKRHVWIAAAACAILFAPWFDLGPGVRAADRLLGIVFAWGACAAVLVAARGRAGRGFALWLPWTAAVAALQLVYWSVVARFVVFLLPPLAFALWETLEAEAPGSLERLGRAGFAAAAALGLALGAVDWTYAGAQREIAARTAARARERGGTLWFCGHWGLQEYMLAAGGRQLDADRGGWGQVRPGDVVVVSDVNTNRLEPSRPVLANRFAVRASSAIPLRHMGDRNREGGFYSSGMGFLPWTFSTAPVDSFTIVEVL
ncbi:MAG: glycosyltransferase family 39 protein, partial [Elusimicrobia bacterium]|nr:glycosyltransferase family 39 protein [Elusimicrobiota bacterium]